MKKLIPLLTLLLLLLAGCGGKETVESQAVCLVLGAHANAPAVNVMQFYQDVYDVCYNRGSLSVVSVSGQSQVAANYEISPPANQIDEQKRRQLAESNTVTVLKALQAVSADTPEVDTLGALKLAGDLLANKDAAQKSLIIADSMLSTTALLDFSSSNLIEQEPEAIVEQLEQQHAIPDLTGIDVRILGLGQTAGDQLPLTSDYQYKLQRIWAAILNAAGCLSLEIDTTPLGGAEPEGLPHVSTVPVIASALSFTAEDTLPEAIRFDESTVKFVGDSAELVAPEQAKEVLQPVAVILRDAPGTAVILAGMTASTGGDGIDLSLRRAQTVKSILTDAGVEPSQITCVGLGQTENFLRANDLDSSGQLIEEQAKLNRAVFLFLKDSSTADRLGLN